MIDERPPVLPAVREAAERAIARAAGVARVSSFAMLVLGAVSVLVSVRAPLSAGFAISVAVCLNGWFERRFGRRLAARDPGAPWRLALNQVALGLEVLAYAAWQAHAIGPEQIDAVLRRPFVARFLTALDPSVLANLLEQLPAAVRLIYFVVGGGTCLGCLATAGYYASRARAVRMLAGKQVRA
jgi:hypothetical protein